MLRVFALLASSLGHHVVIANQQWPMPLSSILPILLPNLNRSNGANLKSVH